MHDLFSQRYSTNCRGHKPWDFCPRVTLWPRSALLSLQVGLPLPASQAGVAGQCPAVRKLLIFSLNTIHRLFRPSPGGNTALQLKSCSFFRCLRPFDVEIGPVPSLPLFRQAQHAGPRAPWMHPRCVGERQAALRMGSWPWSCKSPSLTAALLLCSAM